MTENLDLAVVNVFVEELSRAGVQHVCISPGSRSTPLTIAIARQEQFRVWSLLDERSAGYFAYGLARQLGQPVALVCTSGTATANYLPAVMEAAQSRVPLLVLTADRPPELQGVGSNQTVDQIKLYGSHVKLFVQMPVPSADKVLLRQARQVAWRAVNEALAAPAGPVHLNWPFREPLIPPDERVENAVDVAHAKTLRPLPGALALVGQGVLQPERGFVDVILRMLNSMQRGLIVCGPQDDVRLARVIMELATQLQIPVLADPLSQLRTSDYAGELIIEGYDILFREERWFQHLQPDVILRFGQVPTSKVLGRYLQAHEQAWQVVVDVDAKWRDPYFTATHVAVADPLEFCLAILNGLSSRAGHLNKEWTEQWVRINEGIQQAVEASLAALPISTGLFEGQLPRELMACVSEDAVLVIGNSMPIRDFDSFLGKDKVCNRVLANRGVSGIDGVVSTALGVSAAVTGPVVLVIGDVSFYHDLNALLVAKRHHLSLVIVLVHNDGGGIFSFLPQVGFPETFDHFRTAHGLDFQAGVEMYDGKFTTVDSWQHFRRAVTVACQTPGVSVVEIRTDGDSNVLLHQKVFRSVQQVLEGSV